MTASQNTKEIPHGVKARAAVVRLAIMVEKAHPPKCLRCDGQGFLEREDWIVTDVSGKRACFRCDGVGRVCPRYADPLRVRYAVANKLIFDVLHGNVESILDKRKSQVNSIYWPVLEGVFARAVAKAKMNRAKGGQANHAAAA